MSLVHAFRRVAAFPVELFGLVLKFAPDTEGRVVCEVPEGQALDRLLEIPEAYRLLGATPKDEPEDAPVSPYLLSSGKGDETIDLLKLTKDELIAFAEENEVTPPVDKAAKKQAIADAIVAFFKVE